MRLDRPHVSRVEPAGGRVSAQRRGLVALVVLLLGAWFAVVFAGAMARANDLAAEAARVDAETQVLRDQVAAGESEIARIQTEAFLGFRARAYGYGQVGSGDRRERTFALRPGAPKPAPITPLGGRDQPTAAPGVIEDWLTLLFGG
jgi:hypothetical protein